MKRDEGRRLTDAELDALEKRIREMYGGAAKNLQQIIDEYFANFRLRDEEMRKLIGTIVNGREWTEEDYKQWRLAQMGRGQRFEALRDKLAERLTNANEVAISYVNDATPGIYTLNRNYAAYEVSDAGGDFTLYDEQTVRRLTVEQPDLMPYYPKEKAVRRNIDLEYGKKQITNAVTSGILMGRSIREIAADLRRRITDMEIESAIRAARTAVTAAENGGRQATYEKAAEMGIDMEREWIATKDHRTRKWHGKADGQRVGMEEAFTVGGEKLMFPGDTSHGASGWNIYNCRCSVKAVVKGHGRKRETYTEWLEKKMAEDPEGTTLAFKKAARRSSDYAQWQEYRKIVGDNVPKTFDDFQNFKYTDTEKWKYVKGLKKYLDKYPESSQPFYDVERELKTAGIERGVVLPPVQERAYILPSGKRDPYHIMHRMLERGITDDEVRGYMDNAKIMFVQWNGRRKMFVSSDGISIITRENDQWIYKTAWKRADYDEEIDTMMEAIKNAGL
jgi:uncharacterized protein with gpF-like domain